MIIMVVAVGVVVEMNKTEMWHKYNSSEDVLSKFVWYNIYLINGGTRDCSKQDGLNFKTIPYIELLESYFLICSNLYNYIKDDCRLTYIIELLEKAFNRAGIEVINMLKSDNKFVGILKYNDNILNFTFNLNTDFIKDVTSLYESIIESIKIIDIKRLMDGLNLGCRILLENKIFKCGD